MQDTNLINEVLRGDQRAFKQLVEKYTDTLFGAAIGFVHNREEAEEIVQDSFVKAYQSLAAFGGRSSFSTWLYRITINQSINYLRAKKRKKFWLGLSETFVGRSTDTPPDTMMEAQEQGERIRRAIESLPEKQRVALILSKYEELPQKEIAGIMNVTEGAVEQLMQRAKTNLRKKLAAP